jgi:Ca-activated chloride channel family protein
VKIVCKLSRARVPADAGCDLDLLVRLRAPLVPATAARAPLCVLPIVDVSGSMRGAKIEAVRRALERLVDQLAVGDRVGLVTFDAIVSTPLPIVEVTEARKADLRRIVQGLRAGTSTNLGGGASEGFARIAAAQLPRELRARAILLTDGLANAGAATTREQLVALVGAERRAASLSAFGYGDDCDHALLADLAETGGGSFAYIAGEDQVMTAFARELGGLVGTYAADVRARIEPTAGAPVEESLGDLLFQSERVMHARIAVPAHGRAVGVEVCAVEVQWRDARGAAQRARTTARLDYVRTADADVVDDAEVARAADERLLRDAQSTAERLAQGGRFDDARAHLQWAIARLRDATLARFAREVLFPAYRDRQGYCAGSPVRGSTSAVLRGARVLACVPSVDALRPSAVTDEERRMERAFRRGEDDGGSKP